MYSSMVLGFFQNCVQGLIASIFFSSYLSYRKAVDTWYKKAFLMAGVAAFTVLLTRGIEWYAFHVQTTFVMGMNMIIALVCYFLICHLLFSGKIPRKIFLALLVFLILGVFETLAIFLANPLWSEERLLMLSHKEGLLYQVVYCLTYFLSLMAVLLVKRYRKGGELVGGNRLFIFQCLLPASSLLFLYAYSALPWVDFDLAVFALLVGFVVLVNAYGYVIFSRQQKYYMEKYENLLIAQDYQHREAYYKELEEHQKAVQLIRHDLKNQLLAVSDGSRTLELKEVLQLLEQSPVRLTENIGLNQLIVSKMRIAQESDIACNFKIQVPETMGFRQIDIGALVGNILDNAIEACQRCPADRALELELIYQGHALVIRSINSTDGEVDTAITSKKDTTAHGFGMRSIRQIVEKYDGTLTWKVNNGKFELDGLIWEPF